MLSYNQLISELAVMREKGVTVGSIGQSTLGQEIPFIFVGKVNAPCLIVQSAIHAREHITALLTLCMAKYLVANDNLTLNGGVYFIPMANPDGVRICQEGVNWIDDDLYRFALPKINGSDNFSLFKSNANCVDLNVNFDAKWGKGNSNVTCRASENYVGKHPNSEVETCNLIDFTYNVKPIATLSYHCKGEEVYWQFGQSGEQRERDERYARAIAKHTGYKLVDGEGSCGGYKDWCIEKLGIPSYTIEVGSDRFGHPYPYSQIDDIVERNIDLPRRLLNSLAGKG